MPAPVGPRRRGPRGRPGARTAVKRRRSARPGGGTPPPRRGGARHGPASVPRAQGRAGRGKGEGKQTGAGPEAGRGAGGWLGWGGRVGVGDEQQAMGGSFWGGTRTSCPHIAPSGAARGAGATRLGGSVAGRRPARAGPAGAAEVAGAARLVGLEDADRDHDLPPRAKLRVMLLFRVHPLAAARRERESCPWHGDGASAQNMCERRREGGSQGEGDEELGRATQKERDVRSCRGK
jgi:hypothetical protein